jgi:lysophospholipase L1-like esterase
MPKNLPRLSLVLLLSMASSLALMPLPASAQGPAACNGPSDLNRLDQPLRRTAERLRSGQPVTIVALGSSSTSGAGASSSAASYPSRLEVELRDRFPASRIRVLNRGVGGEEVQDMLARFESAVLAEKPDLVLWQVGSNTVLRGHSVITAFAHIAQGLRRLKASGADVVLIDPQFAPKVIVRADAEDMVGLITAAAKAENVGLFHRFAVMRHWHKTQKIPFETFLSPDGLHLNDWSYACVAKLLAATIAEAATRATAVAGGPSRSAVAVPSRQVAP